MRDKAVRSNFRTIFELSFPLSRRDNAVPHLLPQMIMVTSQLGCTQSLVNARVQRKMKRNRVLASCVDATFSAIESEKIVKAS